MGIAQSIDDFISLFSPAWALERSQSRLAYSEVRSYEGAKIKDRDKYWLPTTRDADGDVLPNLTSLRARSRDLIRNNCWARSIYLSMINYVIGDSGITPQVNSPSETINTQRERRLLSILNTLDITGKLNWRQLQEMVVSRAVEDGECFIRIVMEKDTLTGKDRLKYQFIEADQIYSISTYNQDTGNEIRAGIEIERSTGKHIAYYINQHPGDSSHFSRPSTHTEVRVPAADMIHLFRRERPNQTRGVPLLAPIMTYLRDLEKMNEAEIVKNRIAACLAVFIRRDTHPGKKSSTSKHITSMKPGMVAHIGKNEDIMSVEPKSPGGNYSPFMKRILQAISAAVKVGYSNVTGDYAESNYSSLRMEKLDERRTFLCWQNFIVDDLCVRTENEIFAIEVLRGERVRRNSITWQPSGFDWVDPEKEIKGAILAYRHLLDTKSDIVARRGKNYRDIVARRSLEIELEKQYGIESEDREQLKFDAESEGQSTAAS